MSPNLTKTLNKILYSLLQLVNILCCFLDQYKQPVPLSLISYNSKCIVFKERKTHLANEKENIANMKTNDGKAKYITLFAKISAKKYPRSIR